MFFRLLHNLLNIDSDMEIRPIQSNVAEQGSHYGVR